MLLQKKRTQLIDITELLNIFLIFQIAGEYKTGQFRGGAESTQVPTLLKA